MKKQLFFLALMTLAVFYFLPSCNNSSSTEKKPADAKVTDIPATTRSPEALAAFKEALSFYDLNDIKNARTAFSKAIELDPKFGLAYLLRANTSQSAKEYADNIASGKANIDSASNWEKMFADYMSTNLTGDRNKGLDILQKIAAAYPDAARAQVDLGNAYSGNNQFDKAREAFTRAVQLDPNWVGGYAFLAGSYLFNEPKDLKKAEENAMKIVSMAPKSPGAEISLGDVYRAQNDFQKAKDAYTKAIQLNADGPEAYYKLGHSNIYLGNFEEARKNYADGGMHDASKSGPVLNTAYTYLFAGDTKAADKYLLDEIAKMNASGASKESMANDLNTMLTTLGAIAVHTGDAALLKQIEPMIRSTSDQVTKDLGNTAEVKVFGAADSLRWQAMIALAEGKMDEAKAKLEAMKTTLDPIKDDRKLEGYHADMGLVSLKEKNYKDAIAHFEKADPNSIYNKYLLAKANEAAGNKENALALYKEVAAYNFNDVGNALVRSEVKKKLATP